MVLMRVLQYQLMSSYSLSSTLVRSQLKVKFKVTLSQCNFIDIKYGKHPVAKIFNKESDLVQETRVLPGQVVHCLQVCGQVVDC
jgi:hypothetical protein